MTFLVFRGLAALQSLFPKSALAQCEAKHHEIFVRGFFCPRWSTGLTVEPPRLRFPRVRNTMHRPRLLPQAAHADPSRMPTTP